MDRPPGADQISRGFPDGSLEVEIKCCMAPMAKRHHPGAQMNVVAIFKSRCELLDELRSSPPTWAPFTDATN